MKKQLIERITRYFAPLSRTFALFCALGAVGSAAADFTKTNPVTGETENYTWKFVGTDTWNGTQYWQNSDNTNPDKVPARSYTEEEGGNSRWEPILFDGNTININASMSVEGWNLRMGLYNGASVTMNTFVKYQGDTTMWMTVDDSSQLTIGGFGGGNITDGQVIKLSSANANGITWNVGLTSGNANNTFEYYLKGAGSVSYQAVSAANHMIKMADITLSGTLRVASKTLVSFTSSTKTFTADATIKRLNSSGTDLGDDAHVAYVTSGATTLTGTEAVGTCELVQTSTGIVLYWVDGDPSDLTPTVYKPSISVNFTSGTALSTAADVGVGDYAIPGTSWNNLIGNNGSLTTVTGVDSTGVASTISGAKVTISGTRGYWTKSGLAAASDLRQAYIDDDDGNATPTILVEGIPYDKYNLVLYFSNDTDGRLFGHLTVNGTNYRWDSSSGAIVTCSGVEADCWGSSDSTAYTEGCNYLVFPAITNGDGTLTVAGHRWSGTERMGIAAMQIVEYVPEAGENDLEIAVDGDTAHTVTAAEAEKTGTVYLTGAGTLTLSGEYKINAATIDVGKDVVLNINSGCLDATTFTGSGTVVYNGSQPDTTKGFTNKHAWVGTVWVKNIGSAPAGETSNTAITLGTDTAAASSNSLNSWGNANSYVKFTNVRGHIGAANCPWTLILEDGADTYAWYNNNGWTGRDITIAALEGDGTFYDKNNTGCRQILTFTDASNFTGTFNIAGKRIGLGGNNTAENSQNYRGTIEVVSGTTATVASGKTWTTGMGFRVYGTLNANGSLAADGSPTACVSGSGIVVFDGKTPSPTGNTWWKNAAWTGTVKISNHTLPDNWLLGNYGNSGSKVCLDGVSGPIKNGEADHDVGELIIAEGGYTHTGKYSSGTVSFTVPCKISGSGTYKMNSTGAASKTTYFTGDMSEFAGELNFGDEHSRFVIGSTEREFVAKSIVVGSGKTLNINKYWAVGGGVVVEETGNLTVNSSGLLGTASAGVTINGTVKANGIGWNWGLIGPAATPIVVNDTGVLELTGSSGTNDTDTDMSVITGTGTIRYKGEGYRSLPKDNPFASTLTLDNQQPEGLLLSTAGATYTIGSLSGSGGFRADAGWGSEARTLCIVQSKDTDWSGIIRADSGSSTGGSRIGTVRVDSGTTAGTLTLSGNNSTTVALNVSANAKVNLTGIWKGATTVAGTFGGTGTLTGNLTFSNSSNFKVFDVDEDGLSVSGDVSVGSSVVVTLADGVTITESTPLITATGTISGGTFRLDSSIANDYMLWQNGSSLEIAPKQIVSGGNVVGYWEGTMAVITDVSSGVTIPDGATGAIIVGFPGNSANISLNDADTPFAVYASNATGGLAMWALFDSTSAETQCFTAVKDGTSVSLTLNEAFVRPVLSGSVTVSGTETEPMAVASTGEPTFAFATKPGLWYAVVASDSAEGTYADGSYTVASSVEQATGTAMSINATVAPTSGVKYYKIAVGAAKAALQ